MSKSIDKLWCEIERQSINYEGRIFSVCELIESSKKLPTQEAPLDVICINSKAPCEDDLISFIEHAKGMNSCDLSYPIILSPHGTILDGHHRVAKAHVYGKKTIKFKKFPNMDSLPPSRKAEEKEDN